MQLKFLQSPSNRRSIQWALLMLLFAESGTGFGQEALSAGKLVTDQTNVSVIEIPNEPKTVDPATLVPPSLAKRVTVKFEGDPLKTVLNWLQREQSISLLIDEKALSDAKLLDSEPVFDELNDAPLYLLLNRLDSIGVAWYIDEDSIQITTRAAYAKHDTIVHYHLGDLFDVGYLPQELIRTITRCSGGHWDGENGATDGGAANLIGDVLFVRQTDSIHREVAGLLTAIRKHGKRTFTLDSPQHEALRSAGNQKVTIDFQETPLFITIQELASQTQIGIRIEGSRDRTPVSLKLTDQKLSTVLRILLSSKGLGWYYRDELLWISSADNARRVRKTAVFDVRDLCRDQEESQALKDTIQKQTREKWNNGSEASGAIETPKPGVLIARHTEATLDEVSQILESYRTALRVSKLRTFHPVKQLDPAEVTTGYYRMPRPMAESLRLLIPQSVLPNTWKSPHPPGTQPRPEEIGEILEVSADAKGGVLHGNGSSTVISENVVLVIRHTRSAHEKIGSLIESLNKSLSIDREAAIDTKEKPKSHPGVFGRSLISSEIKPDHPK